MKPEPLYSEDERPRVGHFVLHLLIVCALVLLFALRYADSIDAGPPATRAAKPEAEDCRVFVTNDAGYRAMLVECTVTRR